MTADRQPHPQRCETCECFEEVPQPQKFRCTWNCCFMHPMDECICKPPHWKEASHSSAGPVPEPEKTNGGDPWNCTDLGIECPDPEQDWCNWPCDKWLEYHDAGVARAERERALDAIWQWLKEHDCWKSDHGNYWAPVPFPASDLMQYLESLRGEQR